MDVEQIPLIEPPGFGGCAIRDSLRADEVSTPDGGTALVLRETPRKYTEEEYTAGNLPLSRPLQDTLNRVTVACAGCLMNRRKEDGCYPNISLQEPVIGKLHTGRMATIPGYVGVSVNWK